MSEQRARDLSKSLMSFIRESPILDQAEVERIMVEELQSLGYTVTKNDVAQPSDSPKAGSPKASGNWQPPPPRG